MNNIYLKKLVQQETLNVKIQLVKEHIQIAKNEHIQLNENINDIKNMSLILEQEINTSDESEILEPKSTDKYAWSEDKINVAKFIMDLPTINAARKLHMGSNPYAYEVQVTITPQASVQDNNDGSEDNVDKPSVKTKPYKNMFRFYSDGSVYDYNLMTRLGWNFKDNKIQIMAKNPSALVSLADDKVLATIDDKGKFTNLAYGEESSGFLGTGKKPKKSWLDTFQTILDWAGLIPVIGDGLDALNALIYFFREKWFEGFLSLIAIIPVIGSVIKLGVKGAFRAAKAGLKAGLKGMKLSKFSAKIKSWWLKGNNKAMQELGADLIEKGVISPKQLKRIGGFFGGVGDRLRRMINPVKKIIGDNFALKQLDAAAKKLKDGMEGFRKAADKAGDAKMSIGKLEIPRLGIGKAFKGTKFYKYSKKAMSFLTLGLGPAIVRMPWYPAAKLTAMAEATTARFIKSGVKDPGKLGALSKFMSAKGKQQIVKQYKQVFTKMKPAEKEVFENLFKQNPSLRKYFNKNTGAISWSNLFDSGEHTTNFFTAAKTFKRGKAGKKFLKDNEINLVKQVNDLGEIITKNAIDHNNPMWNVYKNADLNKLISGQTVKTVQLQLLKNVDWIWNEMQQVGDPLGFETSENLSKVGIVPLSKWLIASATPGGYKNMAQGVESIKEFLALGGQAAATAVGPYVQLQNLDEYPPLGATAYTYGEDEA